MPIDTENSLKPHQIINNNISLLEYLNTHQLTPNTIKESQLPIQISCPLHKDNKPSFRLYRPKENGGYCFSCGKAYTAFSMHQALNGTSYKDTINYFKQAQEFQYLNLSQLIDNAKNSNYDSESAQTKYLRTKELSDSVKIVFKHIKKLENEDLAKNFRELEKRIFKAYKTGTIFKIKNNQGRK